MPEKPIRRKKKVEEGGEGVQRREEARTDGPVGRKEGALKEEARKDKRPSGGHPGQPGSDRGTLQDLGSLLGGGSAGNNTGNAGGLGGLGSLLGGGSSGSNTGNAGGLGNLGDLLGGGSTGNNSGNAGGLGNLGDLLSGMGNSGNTANTGNNAGSTAGNSTQIPSGGSSGTGTQIPSGGSGGNGTQIPSGGSGGTRQRGGCGKILLILIVLVILFFFLRSCMGGGSSSGGTGSSQSTGSSGTTATTGTANTETTANTSGTGSGGTISSTGSSTQTTTTANNSTGTANNSTGAVSSTGSSSGSYGSLSSLFGNTVSNETYNWNTSSNIGQLDTTVAQGARPKRTKILGNGQDVITLMVYMCGTDLESRSAMASRDLQEMLNATLNNPNLRVLVYTGGCKRWQNNIVSSQTNQIYVVYNGQLTCLENNVGSKPMVDPATLTEFIKYCVEISPANRYDLIFWDHGGGSESGYGLDEKYPTMASMSLAGINKALYDAGVTFDFIGFDACLMATVENALVVGQYADYLIGSEETEPGVGWYYTDWLTNLAANTSLPTLEIGRQIADGFTNACATTCYGQDTTLSVVDLAELAYSVPSNLTAFATSTTKLIENNQYKTVSNARSSAKEFAASTRIDQVDLVHLASNMGTQEGQQLAKAVLGAVKYNTTSRSVNNAYGLSVYFPYSRASKVDSMVNTYETIGMDEEYTRCIKEFASLGVAGQVASGGSAYGMDTLLEQLLGGSFGGSYGGSSGGYSSSYGGAYSSGGGASGDMIAQLLSAYLSSGRSSVSGLTAENTKFMDVLNVETAAAYIAENLFDPANLEWKENENGERIIAMSDEQWSNLNSLKLNFFYDDGEGILDLGMDNLYDTDENDDLLEPQDRTWLSINGMPVAYYSVSESGDEDDYTIIGRIPAEVNGDQVNLIVVFNSENEDGFVAGAVYDYEDEDIGVIAKSLLGYEAPETAFEAVDGASNESTAIEWNSDLAEGYEIRFLCDSYDPEGNYEGSYYLGDTLAVNDWSELSISNTDVGDGTVYAAYVFTDIFGEQYWTPFLQL